MKLKTPVVKLKTIIETTQAKSDFGPLKFRIRPNTTDSKVIDEVINRNTYRKPKIGFLIKPGQTWLDLGGNIGTFAVLALVLGADKVICYEPEIDNFNLLKTNLDLNSKIIEDNFIFSEAKNLNKLPGCRYVVYNQAVGTTVGQQELYLCQGTYNKYRHSLIKRRGRKTVPVEVITLSQVRAIHPEINAIKIDIEGAEIAILEAYDDWTGIDQLVFEYSFDVDSSIPRFMAIIHKLEKAFPIVHYLKVNPDELHYKHFPAATMVYCLKK